jgi:hypothetical protein
MEQARPVTRSELESNLRSMGAPEMLRTAINHRREDMAPKVNLDGDL